MHNRKPVILADEVSAYNKWILSLCTLHVKNSQKAADGIAGGNPSRKSLSEIRPCEALRILSFRRTHLTYSPPGCDRSYDECGRRRWTSNYPWNRRCERVNSCLCLLIYPCASVFIRGSSLSLKIDPGPSKRPTGFLKLSNVSASKKWQGYASSCHF